MAPSLLLTGDLSVKSGRGRIKKQPNVGGDGWQVDEQKCSRRQRDLSTPATIREYDVDQASAMPRLLCLETYTHKLTTDDVRRCGSILFYRAGSIGERFSNSDI